MNDQEYVKKQKQATNIGGIGILIIIIVNLFLEVYITAITIGIIGTLIYLYWRHYDKKEVNRLSDN